MRKSRVTASFLASRGCGIVLALALSACGSLPRPAMERILQEGDCSQVPDIERLSITVSDHGTKVAFQWNGSRFAGTVQTSAASLERDASYGVNRAGEWEKRFPGISAGTTVPGAYLGFPAASDPRAGIFAATVYDTPYPSASETNRAVAVVDLKTNDPVLLTAGRRVGSVALSPKADYVAVVEVTRAATGWSWRDMLGMQRASESARFDAFATVYSTGGLVACTRELATALPSPIVNVAWK